MMKKLLVLFFVAMMTSAYAGALTDAAGSLAGEAAVKALSKKLQNAQREKGPIIFKTGSAELDVKKCKKTLEYIADIIGNYKGMRVEIQGHTDSVGDHRANVELSRKRAESVKEWLVSYGRVPAKRLEAKGFGPSRPIADNKTEKGRAKNRRVEFKVTKM